MKVLFISNIPAPYRIDFFNELGKYCDLTVVFEAETTPFATFNYNLDDIRRFQAFFVRRGDIREKRVDWGILRHIRRHVYDRVVVTNYAYFTEALAILGLKWKSIPYYMELDGGIIRKEHPLVSMGKRALICGAKGYLSTSRSTDMFLQYYAGKDIQIFRYPFTSLSHAELSHKPADHEEKAALRERLYLSRKYMLLSIGMFTRRKGFDVLMDAVAKLDNPEDVDVCIIGGRVTEEYLEQKERLGLKNVRFLPFQSKETLTDYYRAADVFALATREDVWGLVINEAMAKGLPVITTDRCVAGQEMVTDGYNGYLIPSENPELLANRISAILEEEPLRNALSEHALKTAAAYTIEEMAKAHMKILEGC